jgi:hypothetical protein
MPISLAAASLIDLIHSAVFGPDAHTAA